MAAIGKAIIGSMVASQNCLRAIREEEEEYVVLGMV